MSRLRVLCTNADRSVAIIIPAPEALDEFQRGIVASRNARGYEQDPLDEPWEVYKSLWADAFPRGVTRADPGLAELRAGRCPDLLPGWTPRLRPEWSLKTRYEYLCRRFRALNTGGLDERAALEMIIPKSAPAWSTAWEIVDVSDVPTDRTYRNAWRRSSNGGPIYIDQSAAREIRDARSAA